MNAFENHGKASYIYASKLNKEDELVKKRALVCFLIFTLCVFYSSIPNVVFGQGVSLAQQVFDKHSETLQREDIQAVLPGVLIGLKAENIQPLLTPQIIKLVVANPDILTQLAPDIDQKFVMLLKADAELQGLMSDPQVQELLQDPAAIDELARLLDVGSGSVATGGYRITNGKTTETVWVTYSIWKPADGMYPAGWRARGWYDIEPGATQLLQAPHSNRRLYIRVMSDDGTEIEPVDSRERESSLFWIHPSKEFTAVQSRGGNLLKSSRNRSGLQRARFYEYRNGDSHTIPDELRLSDLTGTQIYNQSIDSVVWIVTPEFSGVRMGSGVLIDEERRLVVTNEHVTRGAESVFVHFPYRLDGELKKNIDFYTGNFRWLYNAGYITEAQVIEENSRNDLAIIQLDQLGPTAREIKHDFSKNVEDSMRQGDKVHILGNPDTRLWNWTQGTFRREREGWLELEADVHAGNSGGPVLNGQGLLIGILTAGTDETLGVAAPARNVKALLDTLEHSYTFKIANNTGVRVSYEILWSNDNDWQRYSLRTGLAMTHRAEAQKVLQGYPKIRFDYIAGDQSVTYRAYQLDLSANSNNVPVYHFEYNSRGDRLDLYAGAAAPVLPTASPQETVLLSNYPNPFNPETWIPYKLANAARVTVTIHAADGRKIRTLSLGHQPAGVYQSKSRAAYWDGKNEAGEPVASGVYFYTLTAGDFSATRKMLIRK